MEETEFFHEVDPDGDVELILRAPYAPFAKWDEHHESLVTKPFTEKKRKYSVLLGEESSLFDSVDPGVINYQPPPQSRSVEPTNNATPAQTCQQEAVTEQQAKPIIAYRYRLSSKHLTTASKYFKNSLKDCKMVNGILTTHATGWDPDALLILMNIIHGRHRTVPRRIELERLAKIAVLVDYYGCHEVVDIFMSVWNACFKGKFPVEYNQKLVLWMAISWISSRANIFKMMTRNAIKCSKNTIQTMNLPIPEHIIVIINLRREDLLKRINTHLHDLTIYLTDSRPRCSFECASMLLGALTKQIEANGFLKLLSTGSLHGHSISDILTSMRKITTPNLVITSSGNSSGPTHACKLETFINAVIKNIEGEIEGLELDVV
ncbi:uncharacterized protein PG998_010683 [Apiospora kogelbergensis]|uniref:uncharacterized protein n=1 Tax=Apiospora kogelbergensis TaxID=1337665 RepID=UPI00312D9FF9